jgi:hypothetical protein
MINGRLRALAQLFVLACAFPTSAIAAQELAAMMPNYPTSQPVTKTLVVEQLHVFRLAKYSPPYLLRLDVKSGAPSFATPEDAVLAHFRAMKQRDFSKFMTTWTKDSQAFMRKRDEERGRAEAFWVSAWEKALERQKVELSSWLQYGKYILIEYRMSREDGPGTVFEDTVALTRENGEWKLTQELAADPILANWNAPTGRIQILSDAPQK